MVIARGTQDTNTHKFVKKKNKHIKKAQKKQRNLLTPAVPHRLHKHSLKQRTRGVCNRPLQGSLSPTKKNVRE